MKRANYLGAPAFFELNQACVLVNQALGEFGCYLVGSSLERRDFRDVDVRCIMADEAFDRMFPMQGAPQHDARWSLICCAISLWLKQRTGLPIDFQIQRQTEANAEYPDGERSALGILFDPR